MTNEEKYKKIFETTFDVDGSALGEQFTFQDTANWDSLVHLDLIASLEDEFDVMFEPEDIMHFGSYENGKRILRGYGVDI
ncbi:MAG: acyl carrier protein [Lachnospiraceae bacterium]|nr:acyl carrier protein [Lachnospiraceae bacterium]